MQRDTPLTTTPAQRRREARESRRSARQLPAVEFDLESSEEPANEAMSVNSNNLFPSFLDNNSRAPPSQQVNGNGAPMNGMNLNMPMNAGHQMDVNILYQKILELSEMLRENREQTQAIVAGAEELAVCAANLALDQFTDLHWSVDPSSCQWSGSIFTRSPCRNIRCEAL